MARSQRYSPEQVQEALIATRGALYLAAKHLGCHANTVANYVARYPQIREALDEQRGIIIDVAEYKLYQAILRGENWAVLFCLRTLGRERGYGGVPQERNAIGTDEGLASLLKAHRTGTREPIG